MRQENGRTTPQAHIESNLIALDIIETRKRNGDGMSIVWHILQQYIGLGLYCINKHFMRYFAGLVV